MASRLNILEIDDANLLSFPNPVNEKAARTVAFVVMLVSAIALASSSYWLLV
jgi:hypothetical protein